MPPTTPTSSRNGMSYVEIGVSDLERSLDFYCGPLGLRPADEPPEPPPGLGGLGGAPSAPGVHWLDAGGALVKLVRAAEGSTLGGWSGDDLQRGIRHFGLKVGDVHRRAERLRDAGVTFTLGPLVAVGDVTIAFFRDPDGTLLEIIDGHLTYHEVFDETLAAREAEAAAARPPDAGPVFDHVAVTVADLDTTLAFYRDRLGYRLIGRLDHTADPRGFVIHYLQAGPAVLEVFTFATPTTPPPAPDPDDRLGLRSIGLRDDPGRLGGTLGGDPRRLADPDGVPLRLVAAR
ncbi:VOC family protein [Streptomyces sp. B6B3]|uniref:VOC family protein n=1 Tax=Streptomyces sp. B6B3 TaxID=3153570 RepID=UPI00325E96B3